MNNVSGCFYINNCTNEQFLEILVSEYPWAEEYCYYYIYVLYARREAVKPILMSISESDRYKASLKLAYYYLSKYEKNSLNLATVIPTCNRAESVKFLLEVTALGHRRRGADIIIYDSSSDDKTENVVKNIQKAGYFNVKYVRYSGVFDGFSLDHKIISAYKEFQDDYDYLWICRDGLIPVVDEIFDKIVYYKKKNIGCIIVDTKSRNYGFEAERYYNSNLDCCDFLIEQSSRLQTLGMLILSRSCSRYLIQTVPLDDKTYSLWQMAAPFHAFAKKPYEIVFFTRNVFAENLMASSTHFWSKATKLFEQWAYRWVKVISSLPNEYDDVKEKCFMIYTIDFHPFSVGAIMKMRAYGGLRYSIIKKYKRYLNLVTKTPLWYIYTTSFTPVILAKIILCIGYNNRSFADKIMKSISKK